MKEFQMPKNLSRKDRKTAWLFRRKCQKCGGVLGELAMQGMGKAYRLMGSKGCKTRWLCEVCADLSSV